MTEAVWLVLAIGIGIGFFIGRWWAERQRAYADMRRVWALRKGYRDS